MRYTFIQLCGVGLLSVVPASCRLNCGQEEEPTNTEEEMPDWYYAGGKLGTTFLVTSNAFEQPTASVENANMMESFKAGEALFEKMFMSNAAGTRGGLGPVYVRSSCIHCHPNYGHGTSVPEGRYNTGEIGNGPLLDAAGANAIWNITNVTRSDRRYHYLDLAGTTYATLSSQDPEVQAGFPAYIEKIDPQHEHAEWFTDDVAQNIYNYLTSKNLPVEMTDDEYSDLMIWHRGLAVPAVRGVKDEAVKRGREVFEQIGCAACHRPSWTTGSDRIQDPNKFFTRNNDMPRYPYQTIWPYTDFVQHKLCMENDIRTGWCRTTPLWGRGLHRKITGDAYEARMHDTRARDAVEAIMWHGYSEESDAYESTVKFYNLPKADREAVVKFVNAI